MEKNFKIHTIGKATINSPLDLSKKRGDKIFNFVTENEKIIYNIFYENYNKCLKKNIMPLYMEKAGPREQIFFNPKNVKAAIVTCGGLCPGINNVIRGTVMTLHYFYGVEDILGIPYGFEGLNSSIGHKPIKLTPDKVKDIHEFGGTILGSSRGAQDVNDMVNYLVENNINMLFAIGGDGTLKGADAIGKEIDKQKLEISIVGIPKTIDNDIDLIDKSFGFETSFDVANPIIRNAAIEANGANNGISIVKLMGRDSGFIAASAALSMPVVNFVLVPEMNFQLKGENGFLKSLEKRLKSRKHAVIVVAEGAGQHLIKNGKTVKDASGNLKHHDIGLFLKEEIQSHFKSIKQEVTIKYIDPSYIIRSEKANSSDSIFCSRLAYHAVHGAMAGKTRFVIGVVNNIFVYLPISEVVKKRKKIDLEAGFWFAVLQSTGQPFNMS
ncbi:diphosphate--fructose-6-phosphate 1-phosphotransferase [Flavivirga aquatica]|uniref:ATP-dependent 6-phosphofructokinase n=2 Tax=Flavivirga aquatica TaxID=1849968 RepID=A0A1E5TD34_9FLAO|nr:diphosphate--fructose-6-phosphate 1-phosphotransferase [Flavivirga aquatica]